MSAYGPRVASRRTGDPAIGQAQSRRKTVYLLLRLGALVAFLLGVAVLHDGLAAAVLIVLAGMVAVLTSFGTNAGGAGERAGARAQDRWFNARAAPQGDWPPYAPEPVDPDQR